MTASMSNAGYLTPTAPVKYGRVISHGSWSCFRLNPFSSKHCRASDVRSVFQSSLLKYREFVPQELPEYAPSLASRVDPNPISSQSRPRPSKWWRFRSSSRDRVDHRKSSQTEALRAEEKPPARSIKKMPILFLDEAHKLYVPFPYMSSSSE
jgi:hypothetical protein